MMTITETTPFTSPCGCPACEKWADCDYCSSCSSDFYCDCQVCDHCTSGDHARWEAEYQEWLAQELENEKPFGEWMFG